MHIEKPGGAPNQAVRHAGRMQRPQEEGTAPMHVSVREDALCNSPAAKFKGAPYP